MFISGRRGWIILHLQRLSRLRTAKWDQTGRRPACAESREVWTQALNLRRTRSHATRLSGAPYGLWPSPCRDLRVGKGIQEDSARRFDVSQRLVLYQNELLETIDWKDPALCRWFPTNRRKIEISEGNAMIPSTSGNSGTAFNLNTYGLGIHGRTHRRHIDSVRIAVTAGISGEATRQTTSPVCRQPAKRCRLFCRLIFPTIRHAGPWEVFNFEHALSNSNTVTCH